MFLESFNQGIIMHEMRGFHVHRDREVFNIPEDSEVGIMIEVGYQDTHDVLPEFKTKGIYTQIKKISIGNCISRRIR
jgi:hypothetical protein